MSQSDFMSLQPWIKHINNMVNSLNISQKCCGEEGFCQWRRRFPSAPVTVKCKDYVWQDLKTQQKGKKKKLEKAVSVCICMLTIIFHQSGLFWQRCGAVFGRSHVQVIFAKFHCTCTMHTDTILEKDRSLGILSYVFLLFYDRDKSNIVHRWNQCCHMRDLNWWPLWVWHSCKAWCGIAVSHKIFKNVILHYENNCNININDAMNDATLSKSLFFEMIRPGDENLSSSPLEQIGALSCTSQKPKNKLQKWLVKLWLCMRQQH